MAHTGSTYVIGLASLSITEERRRFAPLSRFIDDHGPRSTALLLFVPRAPKLLYQEYGLHLSREERLIAGCPNRSICGLAVLHTDSCLQYTGISAAASEQRL